MARSLRPPQGILGLTGLFGLLLVVGYAFKSVLLGVDPERNRTFAAYAEYRLTPLTVLFVLIGMASFAVGVLVPMRAPAAVRAEVRFPAGVGVTGIAVGVASFLVLVLAAGLGPASLRPFQSTTRAALLDQYIGRGVLGLAISLMPLFLLLLPLDRRYRWVRRLGLVSIVVVFSLIGSRLLLLGTILSLGVFQLRRSGRRVSISKQLLVALLVAVVGAGLGALLFREQEQVTRPYDLVVRVMGTFDMADTLAVVESKEERFAGLTVLEDTAITFAPRAVWTAKPYFYGGYRLQETAFPGIGEQYRLAAFFPVGLLGESYLNFGLFGIVLCPFLVALGLRYVDSWSTISVDRLAVACFLYGQLLGLLRSPGQFFAYAVVVVAVWRIARLAAQGIENAPRPLAGAVVG